ncbi:MAG: enoyl-CoA hydratase/isomerase family protein [Gammaproteobacteria bacterium]|nr:enoyl-CoA hydratase/isomerase family protein [Gammaproteobacteria bacterium]MBK7169438.1 enoyl-CoA hydratase/isomerase family protein [Gammaproteobacteria bacterium]MBK7520690.1 enoyl-CoA hydratase/isomerase family protein [Gammaproteobacteria bacterium]MBK7728398.1 enoyl-CoA hydratase/isomerase family protein [Gammaproteobacteria bacterium]MBK9664548.1 enoyl-CoA hydratase/isomerase family protein [Gammaproteobacteria bacterium]
MEYQDIRVERIGAVLLIHLDRPAKLNAYTPDMGDELVHAYRAAAADQSLRAVILTGSGRAFCAGADRAFLAGEKARSGKRLGEEEFIGGFAAELAALPLLSIAAINGVAAGIGVTATLPMDLRIVAADAQLVLNFAELGIMPGLGSTYFLPRLVGVARASELLLCSRRIDGETAAAMGLANRAVAATQVLPAALELAHALGDCRREVVTAIKQGLAQGSAGTLTEALRHERQLAARLRGST